MTSITEELIRSHIFISNKDKNDVVICNNDYSKQNDLNSNQSSISSTSVVNSNKSLSLDLSFQDIDRMGNMCGFGRIIDLTLNNNKINRIAGLEKLVHLKRYDC